jgi:hypothetical protein
MPDFALMKSTLTNRHILLLVILSLAIVPYFIKLGASS